MEKSFFWYIIAGVIGGILGGMGLGGGTLLIPILSVFFNFSAHASQAVNLASFVPMAVVAVILHLKNKLIEKKGVLYIIIPATIVGIGASLISVNIKGEVLSRCFGGFLTLLALYCFVDAKKQMDEKKNRKNVKKN